MTLYQCQVPLGGLPVHLVLVGNKEEGKVVFTRVAPYTGDIIDHPNEKGEVWAGFGEEGFLFINFELNSTEYFKFDTIYDYKSIPLMLKWLQQQKLEQPL